MTKIDLVEYFKDKPIGVEILEVSAVGAEYRIRKEIDDLYSINFMLPADNVDETNFQSIDYSFEFGVNNKLKKYIDVFSHINCVDYCLKHDSLILANYESLFNPFIKISNNNLLLIPQYNFNTYRYDIGKQTMFVAGGDSPKDGLIIRNTTSDDWELRIVNTEQRTIILMPGIIIAEECIHY